MDINDEKSVQMDSKEMKVRKRKFEWGTAATTLVAGVLLTVMCLVFIYLILHFGVLA